jgi:hypothetical protein
MTYFADLDRVTLGVEGTAVRAVGWLARGYQYPVGPVPADLLPALRKLRAGWGAILDIAPWWPAFMGVHQCELCTGHHDTGDIAVPFGQVLFVAPTMIVHYIEIHQYLPPTDFVEAATACPEPIGLGYAHAIRAVPGFGEAGVSRIGGFVQGG